MVGLLDIGARSRKVTFKIDTESDAVKVSVSGISAKALVGLIERFPQIRDMFSQKEISLTADEILKLAPDVVAAVISAGIGYPGDEKQEESAAELPIGAQVELIVAIVEVSFPLGLAHFVASMERLGLDTNSLSGPSVATGKDQPTKLPSQLNGSSESVATAPATPGPTPPSN